MADKKVACKQCSHTILFDEDRLDEFRCPVCGCREYIELSEDPHGAAVPNHDGVNSPRQRAEEEATVVDQPEDPASPGDMEGKTEWFEHWWVYPLVFVLAIGSTVALYYLCFPHIPDKYWRDLWLDRGWFQHVNTCAFLAALGLVAIAWLGSRTSKKNADALDRVASEVHKRWASNLQKSSIYDSNWERKQRNQGGDLLGALAKEKSNLRGLFFQRIYRISKYLKNTRAQNLAEMMDINRDLSALDQESLDGRFTFVRYAVYLMPVIGFLGTVWGISAAMVGIGNALPNIKDLAGFTGQLGDATHALQVAFDTTLLALLYSGIMTLFLTVANSRSGSFLCELDTWVIDNVLSHVTEHNATERTMREGFALLAGVDGEAAYRGGLAGVKKTIQEVQKAMPGKGSGNVEVVVNEIIQLRKKVVESLAEIRESQSVAVVQKAILATMEQLKKLLERPSGVDMTQVTRSLDTLAKCLQEIQQGQVTTGQQIQQLEEPVMRLPSLLDAITKHVTEIHEAQANGHENLQRLTAAVVSLPNFADKLEAAAHQLSSLGAHLEQNRLVGISETLQQISANTGRIQMVRDALAKDVDGKTHDTISAITSLGDVLGGKVGEALQNSNRQIGLALNRIADLNSQNKTAFDQINVVMRNVGDGLLELARELRESRS